MSTWLDPIQHRLCSRPRCQLPIAGVGEAYGLCDGHGHEERNRRLAERDAKARTATQRPIVRGLTVTPVDRPLSAIVGARPTPPIQPSAATVAAKEPSMAKPLTLKPNADALPPTVCRIAGCDAKGHARGLCSPHYAAARANRSIEALALPSTQTKRPPKPVDDQRITTEAGLLAALGTLPPPARGIVERLCTEAPKLRQDLADAVARAEATKRARQEQEAAERELLEVSADVARVLGIDTSGDYDLIARAREVMAELATVRAERAEMLPWHNAARECAAVLGIDTPEALVKRARDSVEPPPTAVRCGSVQVFEVGGEPPTATLIGDQDAIRALARLGLYRECNVYEIELGLLIRKAKG